MVKHETQNTTTDWLTIAEAATHLRTGRRSLYNAIKDGALRASRINDRGDLRISRAWLLEFLERRAERPAA